MPEISAEMRLGGAHLMIVDYFCTYYSSSSLTENSLEDRNQENKPANQFPVLLCQFSDYLTILSSVVLVFGGPAFLFHISYTVPCSLNFLIKSEIVEFATPFRVPYTLSNFCFIAVAVE
ncbi:hypothetical protein TNIN_145281 [Trichonephila inaurata madagascariensis]|uniref:Uncharacterized protein n=1 Tax=Trichonephila inaurata madagascariensis TaxID=2747483 RepID=A0A8X6XHX1_9ARAC|nr:hypothetical protein TNIN_145281 [Trichonephila inaurata madagascariensis]